MPFGAFLAFCAVVLLAASAPVQATIVIFGHHQGLSGQSIARPGAEVPVYSVRLVNDGNSTLQSIALTLSDLSTPTGIGASAFAQLRLYRSADATFDAGSDSLLGTQNSVALGSPSTISLDAPLNWNSSFPYFIATLTLSTTHVDEVGTNKDAFRVGSAAGAIATSSGAIGGEIVADNANSVSIDVVATQVAFATQPVDATASNGDVVSGRAFATQPVLEARDAYGNVDVDASGSASIGVGSGSGSVSLSGSTGVNWTAGRAPFTNLAVTTASDAASFTLSATSSGLTSATSRSLVADIVATQMVFTAQPTHGGVANGDVLSGVAFQTQPVVSAQDADGRVDTDFNDAITLTTSAPGTLSGTTTRSASSGVATFTDITYTATVDQQSFALLADDLPGGSGGDLPSASTASRTADIVATKIVFATLPSDAAATNGNVVSGRAFTTQPVLEARNESGQRDLNFTGSVSLSLPPGNPSLSGTLSKTWISGRADFAGSGLRVTATSDATTFALSATSGSISGQSTTLTADIIATQMAFATQPADARAPNGDVVSGIAFQTQPTIEARNDDGVVDIHYAGNPPALTVQSGDVTLTGTTSANWSNGRASFSNLAVDAASEGQSFALAAANDGGLTPVTTNALVADIVATQMVFTAQPTHSGVSNGDVLSGVPFQTQPIVSAQDAGGRIDTHFNDTIALTTSAPGTLSGATSQQATSGVATFTNIAYTATADQQSFALLADDLPGGSGGDLPSASTNSRTADIVATKIVFTTLPSDAAATNGDVVSGRAFATQPILEAVNESGQRDLNFTGNATIALASGSATLLGTTSVAWSAGRALFDASGLGISTSGDGVTFALRASATGLADATTSTLTADIVATKIAFTTQPSDPAASNGSVVSGRVFATQPVLEAVNESGQKDLHLSNVPVTLAVQSDAVTLLGTATTNWVSGRAAFANLSASATGDAAPFTLSATSAGLISADSNALVADIVATQMVFTTQPAHGGLATDDVLSGAPFQTQPTLQARDADGRVDTHFADIITLTTSAPGTLSGTTARQAIAGIAVFDDVAYAATEDHQSFALTADDQPDGSGGDLPSVSTANLSADIVATRLVFAQAPRTSAGVGAELLDPELTVRAVHQDGGIDGEFTGPISLNAVAVGQSVPLLGFSASPAHTLTPSNGQVTFTSASYDSAGQLQLLATSVGLESARSATISQVGTLELRAPLEQVPNQLAFQRDATPRQVALMSFGAAARGEALALTHLSAHLSFGSGMSPTHVDTLHLWRDSGSLSLLDPGDRLLGTAAVDGDGAAHFASLRDTLDGLGTFLITWSARSPLQAGWTLRAELEANSIRAMSTRMSGVAASASGASIESALHEVGLVGQPHRLLLSAAPDSLIADSLSSTTLTATIVDAQQRPITTDNRTLVAFTTISGDVWISGSLSAQAQGGSASTGLRAGTTAGTARVRAGAAGLLPDTIDVALIAGPVANIELVADPPSILLENGDRSDVTALLRDAYGNLTGNGEEVSFSLTGSGRFVDDANSAYSSNGLASTQVQATNPGTLRVAAVARTLRREMDIAVVATQPPFISLSSSIAELPASGTRAADITAFLRDARGELLSTNDTTRVRFSIVQGQATLSQSETVANSGLASTQVRSLGLAGPIVVRAEAEHLQGAEIELQARAEAAYRLDLVVVPATIVADRQSTAVLSAVVRDSLGNIVSDAAADISFSIESGNAEIIGPQTAITQNGTAQTTLRSSIRAEAITLRAEAPGLLSGSTQLQLTAGPAAKIQLRASPAALPGIDTTSAELIAEIQDVHGNRILADSTTVVSFSISGGPATVRPPTFSRASEGLAHARLLSTGEIGNILVFAGSSGLAPSTFTIPVLETQPPRFNSDVVQIELVEDGPTQRLDLGSLVTDVDSPIEQLVFTVSNADIPLTLRIDGRHLVASPTTPNFADTVQTTLVVRDPNGLEDTAVLQIAVLPQNDPPRITSVPDTVATVDSLYIYAISSVDADGDAMSFNLLEGPQGMRFDRAIGRAAWRPASAGTYEVRIAVSDGTVASEQTFRLHVVGSTERMAFASEPPLSVRLGRLYRYQPLLLNTPSTAPRFSLLAAPPRMQIDPDTGLISWMPTSGDATRSAVTLVASSGVQQVRQQFQIALTEGNTAPQITSTPITQTLVDSLYLYPLRASDADSDTLVFTIVRGPTTMRINPLNGLISWVPKRSDMGIHDIAVRTYDGQFNDEQVFQLSVQSLNAPPRIVPLKGVTVEGGTATLRLIDLVSDTDHAFADLEWTIRQIDGDPINYTYAAGDVAVLFSVPSAFTQARIQLEVNDPDGNSDQHALRIARRQQSDFNGDTSIDLSDFFALADAFGAAPNAKNWNENADLNRDGIINLDDFFAFIDSFNRANLPEK